jgi:hypothetical protein
MKRIILITLSIIFILTSCAPKTIDVDTVVKEDSTLSMAKDGKTTFNYQGLIDLKFSEIKNTDSVKINNISFSENQNGMLTLHKGGSGVFGPEDVNNIEKDAQDNNKYSEYVFNKDEIEVKDKIAVVKLRYLISSVSPDIKIEDIKRTVKLTMTVLNSKGKTIATKEVEFNVPQT